MASLDPALLRRQYEAMDQARELGASRLASAPLEQEMMLAEIAAKRAAPGNRLQELARADRSQRATEEFNQGRLQLMAQSANRRERPGVRPVTIEDPNNPGKAIVIDATSGRTLGQAPPKPSTEKALPPSTGGKILENQQNLRRATQALALLEGKNLTDEKGISVAEGDKDATGWKGFATAFGDVGQNLLNKYDPSGVDTRAAIADLGSLVIHDRSGAAVTAAEYPRLAPFIPSSRDDPETARKKLRNFVRVYKDVVEDQTNFFKESGYKVPTDVLKGVTTTDGVRNNPTGWSPDKERRLRELQAKRGS